MSQMCLFNIMLLFCCPMVLHYSEGVGSSLTLGDFEDHYYLLIQISVEVALDPYYICLGQ